MAARMDDEDIKILAAKGGGQAQQVAQQVVKAERRKESTKRREQVHDAASKALAAIIGYPLDVRREGLDLARKMIGRR
ncbi:MAG: hypothetical protein Q8R28_15065 [Dehalococcoidia bacterium]|nr:hypothetical protein [Dehalococcoidia bacterium]